MMSRETPFAHYLRKQQAESHGEWGCALCQHEAEMPVRTMFCFTGSYFLYIEQ